MYESFFGFKSLPFKITPDERIFFAGAQRQEMLDALLYAIERGEGIITVVGEVGIGKTTLARVLAKQFSATLSIISIFTPNISPVEMLRLIAEEAQLTIPENATKVVLMQLLRQYFLALHQQGKRFLLVVDEAQTMLTETIEELRLLSNMQIDDIKLVQVLLFGQPELDKMLKSPELRQVKDRVVFHIHIKPLSLAELAAYLAFRIERAGFSGQHFFSPSVVQAIYQYAKGYPRAVNRLADQALMAAFAEQTHQITVAHVNYAHGLLPDSILSSPSQERGVQQKLGKPWRLALGLGGIGVISVITYIFATMPSSVTPPVLSSQASTALHQAVPDSVERLANPTTKPSAVVVPDNPQPSLAVTVGSGMTQKNAVPAASGHGLVQPSESIPVSVSSASQVVLPSGTPDWQALHEQNLQLFETYARQGFYAIQLMSSPWRLRDRFVVQSQAIMGNLPAAETHFYDYSAAENRPRIAMIYGVYPTKDDAKMALSTIVTNGKAYKPDMISFKYLVELLKNSHALMTEY